MKTKANQSGIAALIIIVIAVVAGISFTGYTILKTKSNKPAVSVTSGSQNPSSDNQQYLGTINKIDCSNAGVGCTEYVLQSQDQKSYNLIGKDLGSYLDKTVKIEGQIKPTPPPPTITVTSVEPVENTAEGTLKGQVFCTVKIGEDPCPSSSSIDIESIPVDPRMGSYGPIRKVQTDASGKYEIKLPAGKYDITPQPKTGFPVIVPIANPVTISAGQTTTVNINYMDGTR